MTSLINTLIFLLVNGAVVFSSWSLAGYLLRQSDSFSLRIVATGLLAFAHATIVVLFLGVVVRSLGVWTVPIFSLVVSAAVLLLLKRTQPATTGFNALVCQSWRETFIERDLALILLIALFLVQVVVLLLKVVWLPPHVWDVFVYHLPPAVEWYQQGYIPSVLDTTVNRINGSPLGMTVLAYWFFIFFRDDMLVEMPMLLWALLLVPVSVAVMRQSGVSRAVAIKFAIVIFFVPIVLMQAVTVKDHLGLNIAFVAALLFLAEFLRTRQFQMVPLVAVAFGLMLGYKIVAPLYILAALVVFGLLLWYRQRDLITDANNRILSLKFAGLSAIIMTLIGGYWYLRNLIIFGRLQGSRGIELTESGEQLIRNSGAVDAMTSMFLHAGHLHRNLLELYPRIFDFRLDYTVDLIGISGFGPQFSTLGLIGLVIATVAIVNKKLRTQPVFLLSITAILVFIIMMFLNYNSNSYRILSFFPMVLIAYAGIQLFQSKHLEQGFGNFAVNSILVFSVLWNGVLFFLPQDTNAMRLREFISLSSKDRVTANYTDWFSVPRPSFYHLLSEIPVSEPIAFVGYRDRIAAPRESAADTWRYPYVDRHWQRKVYSLYLPKYFDCEDTLCTVKPELKEFLQNKQVSLVSSCKINRCLRIRDKSFFELMPGLYYFRSAS